MSWLKQILHPSEFKVQKTLSSCSVTKSCSSEKRYVIECLKLKGYLLVEDLEIKQDLMADIYLKYERMAIVFIADAASPLDRIYLIKIKAALHELGHHCFIFERAHFYKSLSRLYFRLNQPKSLEKQPHSIN